MIILIFGTAKLKNIGKDMGGAIKGFKEGMKDGTEDVTGKVDDRRQVPGQTIDVQAKEKGPASNV